MTPADYDLFTRRLTESAAAHPEVLGLVALGSMSGVPPGPDAWSDHDFFLVTQPGTQERFRTSAAWLPDAGRIVLWHRETAHGLKAVWDDGHLAELAVFDLDELHLARVNRYRVLLDRGGVTAHMAAVHRETARRVEAERSGDDWLVGQLLGTLLVGALRAGRGERLSAHRLVRGHALAHALALIARHVAPADGAAPDDLDPFRRVERAWPDVAQELEAVLAREVPGAARGLLDLCERLLSARVPWPRAAADAVRRRIDDAAAALRSA